MKYWLFKTEPTTFSWDDLIAKKKTEWDGVRNYQARNMMRAMSVGDLGFLYHSVTHPEIVGIVKVSRGAHPDSTDTTGVWECVHVRPVKALHRPISLQEVKADPKLYDMMLVTHSRLSVQPVTSAQWKRILTLSQTKI